MVYVYVELAGFAYSNLFHHTFNRFVLDFSLVVLVALADVVNIFTYTYRVMGIKRLMPVRTHI